MGIKKRIVGYYRITLEMIKGLMGRKRLSKASQIVDLTRIVEIVYMFVFCILAAGIINFILEGMNPNFAGYIIVPAFRIQNLIETFVNFFTIGIGAAGLYLMYLSGKKISTRKTASLYLISGILVLIVSVSMLYFVLSVKSS